MEQVALRKRAVGKFGAEAKRLYFTQAGLEQASRVVVSDWRARRWADAGVSQVVDLGCGLGADSLALQRQGIEVLPVEIDPITACFAEANLNQPVTVADATQVTLPDSAAVFCDPARRTATGRTWRVSDFTPPWEFSSRLLDRPGTCLKLGPGIPNSLIPGDADCWFVADGGDVVEASIWSTSSTAGVRGAVLLPAGREVAQSDDVRLSVRTPVPGDFVVDPNGAIARAGLVDQVGEPMGGARIAPDIAYLTCPSRRVGDEWVGDWFQVECVLPFKEKLLRRYIAERGIGRLEIKKRGIEADPAALRKRLRPKGAEVATLIVCPSADGALAIFARRVSWHSA